MSAGVVKRQSLATVIVDTTVQPKAIAHPTDSRLLNRAREQLVAAAQDAGIELRQSYARVGKAADA
jgi:IS5 family transposase